MPINHYATIPDMLQHLNPTQPVYCIFPQLYQQAAQQFVDEFSGRVLYAVKANDHPEILRNLYAGGIRHFDCASLPEIARVHQVCPKATCYFMTPVRLRGAARDAQRQFGVRHFMIDHASSIASLAQEINMSSSVVFVRMAVHHPHAIDDLSFKFGAPPEDVPGLLDAVLKTGAEAALAFNVGSSVISTEAYTDSISLVRKLLSNLKSPVRLVDIGGGFAKPYPGFPAPPISDYLNAINISARDLPLAKNGEIMCEPGRALAAPGMSAVVEVLLRKDWRLYLNDGMYGIFWELRCPGHDQFRVRCYRNGRIISGDSALFKLYGPTCDSSDFLPGDIELPNSVSVRDHLVFDNIGAYSLSGRTDFNGHRSDTIVTIDDSAYDTG